MISNDSLSAFSAAVPSAEPLKNVPRPRQIREQLSQPPLPAHPVTTVPSQRPSVSPPRGTLLNLSV